MTDDDRRAPATWRTALRRHLPSNATLVAVAALVSAVAAFITAIRGT